MPNDVDFERIASHVCELFHILFFFCVIAATADAGTQALLARTSQTLRALFANSARSRGRHAESPDP